MAENSKWVTSEKGWEESKVNNSNAEDKNLEGTTHAELRNKL